MVHAFRTIVQEEGARALYKGWLPSVIGVVCCHDSFFDIPSLCFLTVGMIMFAVSDHSVSAFVLLYVQSLYGLMSTYT